APRARLPESCLVSWSEQACARRIAHLELSSIRHPRPAASNETHRARHEHRPSPSRKKNALRRRGVCWGESNHGHAFLERDGDAWKKNERIMKLGDQRALPGSKMEYPPNPKRPHPG